MQRSANQKLENWFVGSNRKPLVIRGARQVGKTALVRLFAEAQGLVLHEANLERHPQLASAFKTMDPDIILGELEFLIAEGPIEGAQALLFLDEIQAIPEALASLRYFFEQKPDLAVVAAGSLLEFVLADHGFSMPVGRIEYLFLEPMGFREFLGALADDDLLSLMGAYQWGDRIPETAQDRLHHRVREFFLVGGMPEAVRVFQETGRVAESQRVHASILNTWRDDFSRYATRSETVSLQKVFSFVPGHVGQKMKYANIDRQERSRTLKRAVELLAMARIIRQVFHSDGSGIPLGATIKESVFKTFFLDVGLVNAACGVGWISPDATRDLKFINEGGLAEQFIAQHLPLLHESHVRFTPTYWLREGRSNNAEVDFLFQLGTRIFPVEVKAGKSGILKSLQEFIASRNGEFAVRFDMNHPSSQQVAHSRTRAGNNPETEFILHSLPLYMVEELPRLLG